MKEYIKFQNFENIYKLKIKCLSENLVEFELEDGDVIDKDVLLSGFDVVNEVTHDNQSGDYYHEYKTVYKETDNSIILSNDGSVYVPPIIPEPEELTEEELKAQEKELKIQGIKNKISELKAELSSTDYIFIKYAESSIVGESITDEYDFEKLHKDRQKIRDNINVLESELSNM